MATPPGVNPPRLLDLLRTLPAVAGFDAVVRWTSASFPRKLGLSPVGRQFLDFVHPDDHEATAVQFERLRNGKEVTGFEWRMRIADGSFRPMLRSAVGGRRSAVGGRRSAVGGRRSVVGVVEEPLVYGSAQDVTELSAAERRFEQIFADAPIGMALQDSDGRYVQVSRALCELFGRSRDELVGMSFAELAHPDDVQFETRNPAGDGGGERRASRQALPASRRRGSTRASPSRPCTARPGRAPAAGAMRPTSSSRSRT